MVSELETVNLFFHFLIFIFIYFLNLEIEISAISYITVTSYHTTWHSVTQSCVTKDNHVSQKNIVEGHHTACIAYVNLKINIYSKE